jgi:hypothetical protein
MAEIKQYPEGIANLLDSIPDEGPPADARDTNSPNFGMGLSTMEVYEILTPLARMIAEQTGEPLQAILQEMVTDPTAIGRAKSMLGMDPTTPFPNNIREPMGVGEDLMSEKKSPEELNQMLQDWRNKYLTSEGGTSLDAASKALGAAAGLTGPVTRGFGASPLGAEALLGNVSAARTPVTEMSAMSSAARTPVTEQLEGLRGQDRLDKMYEMGMLNEPADPSMVYDPRWEEEKKMYMFEKMNPPPMSIMEKIETFIRSGFSEKEATKLAITGQE